MPPEITAGHRRAKKEPEIPGMAGVVVGYIPAKLRPTAMFVLLSASVVAGSLWLDGRARGYIAEATAANVTAVIAAHTKATDDAMAVVTTQVAGHTEQLRELTAKLEKIADTTARTEGKVDTVIGQTRRGR